MVTIVEVAAHAGVSPATVSRVLNGKAVDPALQARVRESAATLRFVPNRTARRLRSQSSQVLAVMVPDIGNPYWTALSRGMEDVAWEAGYSLILCNTDEQMDKEERYLQVLLAENVAGIVIAPASDATDLARVLRRRTPVVCVDRSVDPGQVDAVVLDNVGEARRATTELYERGFGRVACITGPHHVETAEDRARGWREVFLARSPGLDPDAYLHHVAYTDEGGRTAMAALTTMTPPPDAVFVANNLMGVGAIRELLGSDGGRALEVGMTVLGDLPFATSIPTGVRVHSLPARELGEAAARLLLGRIRGEPSQPRRVVLAS